MRPLRWIAALLLVLFVVSAIALLVIGLYPTNLPTKRDPTFVDTVFDNRGVVWMARLLLVSAAGVLAFGGVFIVVSIGIRMKNGEWLRRAGPFEISDTSVRKIEDQVEFWCREALTERKEAEKVTERLRKSHELVARLRGRQDDDR